jgi:aquaporin Z
LVTLAAIGVDVLFFTGRATDDASRWLARGFATSAAIFAFSEISGAHVNPAVTIGFAISGAFPWRRVWGYVLAQFVGAFAASAVAFVFFGTALGLGASHPGAAVSAGVAAFCEFVLTAVVMLVILATATQEAIVARDAALAVGLTVCACGFFAGGVSGASMNPARTLAPELLTGQGSLSWIYVVGPAAGAAFAVVLHRMIFGKAQKAVRESAQGRPDA